MEDSEVYLPSEEDIPHSDRQSEGSESQESDSDTNFSNTPKDLILDDFSGDASEEKLELGDTFNVSLVSLQV